MTYAVSITSQGQMSVPAKIRNELGFSRTGKVLVSVQDGKMIVEPIEDILDLAGSLKTNKKPLSNEKLHDLFAASVGEEYAKEMQNK